MIIAYFDCFSGISGDMVLGALVDAGLPQDRLRGLPDRLGLANRCHLEISRVRRAGIAAVRVEVQTDEPQPPHRSLAELAALLEQAELSAGVHRQSLRLLRRLAEVEAAIHDTSLDAIHFHELGALDTLVDVVGALEGLEALGVSQAYCSPIVLGGGTVATRHGRLPVPAPATTALLKDFEVHFGGGDAELATPTGAALLWAVARPGPPPGPVQIRGVGYGAGARDLETPNLLRLVVADAAGAGAGQEDAGELAEFETDEVAVLETQVDDLNPQLLGALYPQLLTAGALDVTVTPIHMKKGRPGFAVTVLVPPVESARFVGLLMAETTTLGVRVRREWRLKARRRLVEVQTPYGSIPVKLGLVAGRPVHASPEFEACAARAEAHGVPVRRVLETAEAAARDQFLGATDES